MGGLNLYGYVGNNPINFRDPLGLDAAAAARALGELGTVEEGEEGAGWLGGGNFNPIVDGALAGTAIIGGGIALWEYFQPAAPLPTHVNASKPAPKDCPSGTQPIDQGQKRLPPGVKPHDVKDWAGQGATDWTGVAPNGDIIVQGEDGTAENLGPYTGNPSK
jgi:hypothetical protein